MPGKLLLPLPIQNYGTAETESFPSYLQRVAYHHGVSLTHLLEFAYRYGDADGINDARILVGPDGERLYCGRGWRSGFKTDPPKGFTSASAKQHILGSSHSHSVVRLMESLTHLELSRSTLWFVSDTIGHAKSLVRDGYQWCPECLAEMERKAQPRYFKLMWHLSEVNHCSHHRTPLIKRCASCNQLQNRLKSKYPVGQCQHCGEQLSQRARPCEMKDLAYSWEEQAGDIRALLECMPEKGQGDFSTTKLKSSLAEILDIYVSSKEAIALDYFYTIPDLERFAENPMALDFKTLRRLAYLVGAPLEAFFSGNIRHTSRLLDLNLVTPLPIFAETRPKISRDHERVHQMMVEFLNSRASNPPALAEVAEDVGVSVGYISYRWPAMAAAIVTEHRQAFYRRQEQTKDKVMSETLNFFRRVKYSGGFISKRDAYRQLRATTGLPKFLLKGAIRSVHSEVF